MLIIASNTQHQLNEEIRDREVRLIGADGEQLGIMSALDARRIASEQSLDLVKISPAAVPPVCKIMDYGKFRFEQSKREKEQKRNQHIVEVKEIWLSPGIGSNDFNWKLADGKRFLGGGDRLKVTVRFRRGREMAHTDIGNELLKRFAAECVDVASVDKNPKLEGRRMSMFLSPKVSKADVKPKADAKAKTDAASAADAKPKGAPKPKADAKPVEKSGNAEQTAQPAKTEDK